MGLSLIKSELASSVIRRQIEDASGGVRTIDTSTAFTDGSANPLERFQDFVSSLVGDRNASILFKVGGWLVKKAANLISLSFTSAWGWLTQATIQLWNFDWNSTDAELRQQNEGNRLALYSIWGSAFGSAAGWTASIAFGYGVALYMPVIGSKLLASIVAKAVAEEALEEVSQQLRGALLTTGQVLAQNSIRSGYIFGRKFIRTAQIAFGQTFFGDETAEDIARGQSYSTSWGGDQAPVWSFSEHVGNQVKRLPPNWRAFVDAALDESADAFIEGGYIIARTLDDYLAERQLEDAANPERGVAVYPDRENPNEATVLTGSQEELIPQIQNVVTTHRTIESRDVGQLVGQALDDYVRDKELTLRLRFQLFNRKRPPYGNTGNDSLTRVTITVPDVRRSAIEWNKLRQALGGGNGYLWGRFKARGRIDAKRYVTVYGGTESEAVQRLRAIMQLSNASIQTINVTEELKEGDRLINPRLQKDTTQVYPGYVTIINRNRTIAIDQGRVSPDGRWVDKRGRFDLWRDTEPPLFDQRVQELLRYSGG